eukprot:GHRR01031848.1.p1 GENE.GHRR01031848.1~~GHRR01031848.1.p1  ORF type:complete len:139 (+),score=29.04 GHRR01031848.1:155-571(+)
MAAADECSTSGAPSAVAASQQLERLQLSDLPSRIHCYTEVAPDAVIYFQIIDLGQQLYIWVATGGATFQNLYLAIQSRLVSAAAAACPSNHLKCEYMVCLKLMQRNMLKPTLKAVTGLLPSRTLTLQWQPCCLMEHLA